MIWSTLRAPVSSTVQRSAIQSARAGVVSRADRSGRLEAIKTQAQSRKKVSLEDLFANVQAGEAKELNLIVKADVQGSLDPSSQS